MNEFELKKLREEILKNTKIVFIPHIAKRIENPNKERVLAIVKDRK